MTWCWDRLGQLVVVHLTLLGAEAIVGRGGLDESSGGVVFAGIGLNTLRRVCLGWVDALGSSNSVIGCCAHRFEAEFVLARARHEFVSLLLELVSVHG